MSLKDLTTEPRAGWLWDHRTLVRLGQLAVPILVLILWQITTYVVVDVSLASPMETYEALVLGYQRGWLISDTLYTLGELVVGYSLGVITGISTGLFLGFNKFWRSTIGPYIDTLYSIPKITLYPIFLLMFGIGFNTIVAYGWLKSFLPITIILMGAVSSVKQTHLDVAESMGLTRWQRFRYVIFPSIVPSMTVALRLAFSTAFLGVVVAELFASRAGLGNRLIRSLGTADVADIMAIVVVLMVIAAIGMGIFFALEKRVWSSGEGSDMPSTTV